MSLAGQSAGDSVGMSLGGVFPGHLQLSWAMSLGISVRMLLGNIFGCLAGGAFRVEFGNPRQPQR